MFWLEMSRDEEHGGEGWEFAQCLWAPTYKNSSINADTGGSSKRRLPWPFWNAVNSVKAEDLVLHLRGEGKAASFVGFSTAEADGYRTEDRPTIPGKWGYADSFYRVPLVNFTPFPDPILLYNVFGAQDNNLRQYLVRNNDLGKQKRLVFYVLQSHNRKTSNGLIESIPMLQPLNGAYLSEVDTELATLLLGPLNFKIDQSTTSGLPSDAPGQSVNTGDRVASLKARIGQHEFSDNVRSNYGSRCCFPGCPVNDPAFLVGAHIARWSDHPALRGDTSNGLCLCLMHDKAFEAGFFTVSSALRIVVNSSRLSDHVWAEEFLKPFDGQLLKNRTCDPDVAALECHWKRISFYPG